MKLTVSLGQKITTVPKVAGMTEEEAKKKLEESELEVVVVEEFDKKVEKGIVIKQDVDPETEVGAGSTVTITVSKGIEEVEVPNVIGKTKEEAIAAIEEAGLVVSTTLTTEDKTKDDGIIIKQSLDGGTTVEKGATMTITLNQIAQSVSGTVKINLKSILKYTETYKDQMNTTTNQVDKILVAPDLVEVKVTVDGDTVYKEKHKENETNISVPITGVGTVRVKVYINDILGNRDQTVNLNNQQEIIFE